MLILKGTAALFGGGIQIECVPACLYRILAFKGK